MQTAVIWLIATLRQHLCKTYWKPINPYYALMYLVYHHTHMQLYLQKKTNMQTKGGKYTFVQCFFMQKTKKKQKTTK